MRTALVIISIIAFCSSCRKDNVKAGENVEIYLLQTYQPIAGKCQVDPSRSSLEDDATITNADILQYSAASYQFKLSEKAIQKVRAFHDYTPFAVTVDKEVIYFGIFKHSYSSLGCGQSITMQVDWGTVNKISMVLGYPGLIQGTTIDDQRNNAKLISAIEKQGKLN